MRMGNVVLTAVLLLFFISVASRMEQGSTQTVVRAVRCRPAYVCE